VNAPRPLTVEELRAIHPMPWKTMIFPPNRVALMDAKGQEVPMFVMLEFVTNITERLASQPPTPEKAPS
jgi:hypothetical protein